MNKIFKKIKFPKKKTYAEMQFFFKKKKINIDKNFKFVTRENVVKENKIYGPEIEDLYRLYNFIFLNKRTTLLEFGTGWSSLILTRALFDLKKKYLKTALNLRRGNLFELFVIDNFKKYLNVSKKRIEQNKCKDLKKIKINWKHSPITMETYCGQISMSYQKLHMCNPDFIYVDAPDLTNIKGNIQNIKAQHTDMLPMINDILKFENFLIPGTIIIFDGRAANAIFCKNNFKRNWLYYFDEEYDQHIFYLDDVSLGLINQKLLDFYKN